MLGVLSYVICTMTLQWLVFLALMLSPLGEIAEGSKLLWSPERKLTWNDLRGTPDKASPFAALTRIDMSIMQGPHATANTMELIVSAELVPEGSWVIPDKKTPVILAHEQGHFDIAEYHARRLRKALEEHGPFRARTLDRDVNAIFDRIFREKDNMQLAYDRQTGHSIHLGPQLEWEARIVQLLDSLDAYGGRSVTISLR